MIAAANANVDDDEDDEEEAADESGSLRKLEQAARRAHGLDPDAPILIEGRGSSTQQWTILKGNRHAARVMSEAGDALEIRARLENGRTVNVIAPKTQKKQDKPHVYRGPNHNDPRGRKAAAAAAVKRGEAAAGEKAVRCPKGHLMEDGEVSDDDTYCDGCNSGLQEGTKTKKCGTCDYSICNPCVSRRTQGTAIVGDKAKDGRKVRFAQNGQFFGMLNSTNVLVWPSPEMKAVAGQNAWGEWRPDPSVSGTIAHYWLGTDFVPTPPPHRRGHLSSSLCVVRCKTNDGDRFVIVAPEALLPNDGDQRVIELPRDGDSATPAPPSRESKKKKTAVPAPGPTRAPPAAKTPAMALAETAAAQRRQQQQQQQKAATATEESDSDDDGDVVWQGSKRKTDTAGGVEAARAAAAVSMSGPPPPSGDDLD